MSLKFLQFVKCKFILLIFCLFINQSLFSEGFVAQTLVKTSNGYKQIAELKENDFVVSYSFKNKVLANGKVNRIEKLHYKNYFKLTIDGQDIIAAPDHKFYCPLNENSHWNKAKDLKVGDFISSNLTECKKIDNIEEVKQKTDFYCLTIDTHQNYFISEQNIFVHNTTILIPIFEVLIGYGLRFFGNFGVLKATIASMSTMELYRRSKIHDWNLWDTDVKLPDDEKIKHIFLGKNGIKHGFIGGPNDQDPEKWWAKIAKRIKDAYLRNEIIENGKDFEIYDKQNVNPKFGDLVIRGIILKGVIHIGTVFLKKK